MIAVLAVACNLGPTGVTAYRLASTIGPEFNNATLLQQALIGRHAPPEAKLDVNPQCNRRAAKAVGPGDWTCNLYVYLPQPKSVPFPLTVGRVRRQRASNGCYKAQSPPASSAVQTMRDSHGQRRDQPAVHRLRLLQHALRSPQATRSDRRGRGSVPGGAVGHLTITTNSIEFLW